MFKKLLYLSLSLIAATQPITTALGMCDENTPLNVVVDQIFTQLYDSSSAQKNTQAPATIISREAFFTQVKKSTRLMTNELLLSAEKWVNKAPLNLYQENDYPAIFGQAVIISPNSKVFVISDLHGNVHSLARIIKQLHALGASYENGRLKENSFVIIAGDLGDRGLYSAETWFLALKFKELNPTQVIILQGNHENHGAPGKNSIFSVYGFETELLNKFFPGQKELGVPICKTLMYNLFNILPQFCFMGCCDNKEIANFVQICHAGVCTYVENSDLVNISISQLLEKTVSAPQGTPCYRAYLEIDQDNNTTWGSFTANPNIDWAEPSPRGPGIIFPATMLKHYFSCLGKKNCCTVSGIIRGHDHMSDGVCKLKFNQKKIGSLEESWVALTEADELSSTPPEQGYPVYTVTSAHELYENDAFVGLTFKKSKGSWTITPHINQRTILSPTPSAGLKIEE